MATSFSSLYDYLRAALGDLGTVRRYSDAQLDLLLRSALLQDTSHSEVIAGSSKTITPDCTGLEQGWLVATAALVAVSPQTLVSYRTPVLSTKRNTAQLISELKRLQRFFANGGQGIAVRGETNVYAMFQ